MKFVESARRNAQSVNSMGMLPGITRRWETYNNELMELQTQASRQGGLVQSLSSWLRQSMQVFIYGVGAWLTIRGEASAGSMIASSIIMGRALAPVQMGIGSWKGMVEARGAWKRLDAMLEEDDEAETMDLPDPLGQLTAEDVGFGIQDKTILQGVNFSLEPGESLGLIGPSGAGKSTLCRLLLGIWPASAGAVRLDGSDIYKWDHQKLGSFMGYLSQDVELFPGTVAENIARMGDINSEMVIAAAQQAGVHDLILNFQQGYNTRIGDGGVVLSGGQRQRIGLARALYGNPKLIILDEPNSNLDEDGEKALLSSWQQLREQGTTLIVVSHKPALLSGVDKILMLTEGQVAMFGPRDAVFKKLIEAQNQQKATG